MPTPQQETAPPLDRRSHSAPDISLSTALHDTYDATPAPVGHYTIRAIFALQGEPVVTPELANHRPDRDQVAYTKGLLSLDACGPPVRACRPGSRLPRR